MKLMADFASNYLDPAWKKERAGQPYQLPTDAAFTDIFHGFTEINSTIDAIELIEVLLRSAPPRSRKLKKDVYISFLIGAYLQEIYILEQRLTAYAKKISRLYDSKFLPVAVQQVVFKPLEGIINTRGAHVHQRRFSDKSLDMVSALALFRRLEHEMGDDLEVVYKTTQLEWMSRFKVNAEAIREIVNGFCRLLKSIICNNEIIVLPKHKPVKKSARLVKRPKASG